MPETTMLRTTFRLLLLLTVVVLAAVGSKNEQTSLETLSGFATTPRSTNNTIIQIPDRENEPKKPSPIVHVAENMNEEGLSWNDGENDDGEGEEDGDDDDEGETNEYGGQIDEYEDELREIAESHEAMSRDERRSGISSTMAPSSLVNENRSFGERLVGTKNFDSRENIDEMISDESSVSNEAVPKDDEEVAELLRYKQKETSLVNGEEVTGGLSKLIPKIKRVPTVKKELSTQKEIIAANETQLPLPKTLTSNVDVANRLDDETKHERSFGRPITFKDPNRFELLRGETGLDEEYLDVDTPGDILRKLDKRQPSEPNGLRSYYLDGYGSEREQRRKLCEPEIEECALLESAMELLARLAKDPRTRKRVHRILEDIEGDPMTFTHEALPDSRKRSYSSDSLVQVSLTDSSTETSSEPSSTTKKPKKKKKKKKKKKPRHRFTDGSSTGSPKTTTSATKVTSTLSPLFLTTTASNWVAPTTAQWRLVAERLFGAPWSDDRHESPLSMTKVRSMKDRLASIDEKQRESLKTLNDERQALMLQSAREYSQPRRLHYGKVNTHEKGSPNTPRDNNEKNYDSPRDSPVYDYDLADRSFQHRPIPVDRYDRYGSYGRQRIRDYGLSPVEQQQQQKQQQQDNDYDAIFRPPDTVRNHRPFARTQQFRPQGREYASTKTWQDSRYDYSRPWKDKGRASLDDIPGSNANWPWRTSSNDYKIWLPRYKPWSRERNYWQRLDNVADELGDIDNDEDNEDDLEPRNWQRKQQEGNWRTFPDDSARWHGDRNVDVPTWQAHERTSYGREHIPLSLEKSKNRSELNNKETIVKSIVKDKPIMPKITMKTWNSLTSDPATWPFKLTGAKPWPKDKNGKSYNPNAELVRKLGLDKQQDRLLSSGKDSVNAISKEIVPQDLSKYKISESSNHHGDARNEIGSMVNSAKSSVDWQDKLNVVNGWNNAGKTRNENVRLPQREETRQIWHGNGVDANGKIWSGKSPVSPKISSVGAWVMPADQSTWRPYDLKHTAYGQLSGGPNSRWNDASNSEETDGRSWSTKNGGISAPWPQKMNNDWSVRGSAYSPEKTVVDGHSSTWPSKWRQFAYHKVTAAPLTKPGSSSIVDGSSRPRNSYIAVSAVSAPKYPNNEWRKNEIEENQLDTSASDNHPRRYDQDEPSSQLRKISGVANERWNKQARIDGEKSNSRERYGNDPLEHQLEELRQAPYWNHDQIRGQSQKRSNVIGDSSTLVATTQSSQAPTNSSSMENEILKKHETPSSTVVETFSQATKNVTK